MLRHYDEVVVAHYTVVHTEPALGTLFEYIKSFNEYVKIVLEATDGYHCSATIKIGQRDKKY